MKDVCSVTDWGIETEGEERVEYQNTQSVTIRLLSQKMESFKIHFIHFLALHPTLLQSVYVVGCCGNSF